MRNEGAAEGAAVLVPLEDRPRQTLLVIKEVVRIEVGIANVVVNCAVQLIRSALADDADDAARIAAIFGGVGTFQDAEFRDRIGIGIRCHDVIG